MQWVEIIATCKIGIYFSILVSPAIICETTIPLLYILKQWFPQIKHFSNVFSSKKVNRQYLAHII